jgi:hypothetical protein
MVPAPITAARLISKVVWVIWDSFFIEWLAQQTQKRPTP